jgi:Zn-dependent peptidase ImmA (M78 family)
MSQHTRDSIEQTTQELLRHASALSVPVDVRRVAETLHARIHEKSLEDQVSGVLIVKDGERHILVNSAHHTNRQRFTVGHELGHLVLHESGMDPIHIDRQMRLYQRVGEANSALYNSPNSTTTPQMEREANMFAAALLMPAPLLQHAALEHNLSDEADIGALALAFGVSEQAMTIRLQQLRVVEVVLGREYSPTLDAAS